MSKTQLLTPAELLENYEYEERVALKIDSHIDEETAIWQTIEEMICRRSR